MARLSAWLFAPAPAERLAILRVAIGGYVLYMLRRFGGAYQRLAESDPSVWEPTGPLSWMAAPLDPEVFRLWATATVALAVAFVLGVAQRVLAPLFGLSVLLFFTYRNSWQAVYHSDNLFTLQLLALSLAPAASALSVDAWLSRRGAPLSFTRHAPEPSPHWSYGWPIRLLCILLVSTYLLAGLSKVGGDLGFAWASGENLLTQIGADSLYKELIHRGSGEPHVGLLYRYAAWLAIPASLTLVLELGAPVALLHRRIAQVWVLAVYGMHWGIEWMMGIRFLYPMTGIAFLCFLRPETWPRWVAGRVRWVLHRLTRA